MPEHRIYAMAFAKVYPLYVQKAERKQRAKAEVDQIICWLTGYDLPGLQQQIDQGADFATFFAQAPAMQPHRTLINQGSRLRYPRRDHCRAADAEKPLPG
jgi:hypothetical protein